MTRKPLAGSVAEVMSQPVVSVEMDDRLWVIKQIFDSVQFHHILVVSQNTLVGVLSDRDYLKAISPRLGTAAENKSDLDTLNRRVHQVMSRKPITLRAQSSIGEAITLFEANNVSCIPVVDGNNRPVGIVSWRDIFHRMVVKAA